MKARNTSFIKIAALLGCALAITTTGALAQDNAKSLEQLLQMVKDGRYAEGKDNKAREAQFRRDRANQVIRKENISEGGRVPAHC